MTKIITADNVAKLHIYTWWR